MTNLEQTAKKKSMSSWYKKRLQGLEQCHVLAECKKVIQYGSDSSANPPMKATTLPLENDLWGVRSSVTGIKGKPSSLKWKLDSFYSVEAQGQKGELMRIIA